MSHKVSVPTSNKFYSEFFEKGERNKIISTILESDSQAYVHSNDARRGCIFAKHFNDMIYLVGAKYLEDMWHFHFGFKLHMKIAEGYRFDARMVLSIFVSKFGQKIKIGDIVTNLCWGDRFLFDTTNNGIDSLEILQTDIDKDNLVCVSWSQISESKHHLEYDLGFCINVYEYTKWLFEWDNVKPNFDKWLPSENNIPDVDISFSPDELNSIIGQIRKQFPNDDEHGLSELTRLQLAYKIIYKAFGEEIYQEIFHPSHSNFINRDFNDSGEQRLSYIRLTELADALINLQDIPGFREQLTVVKNRRFDNVESLWFEFYVPKLIMHSGHTIVNFISESLPGKTPDLLIDFHGQLIPVEIKANHEEKILKNPKRSLTGLIRKACNQLPETGPGIVCLLIPPHWKFDQRFVSGHREFIEAVLRDNRNCNGVFIWWFEPMPLGDDWFGMVWKHDYVLALSPKYRVQGLEGLIKGKSMIEALKEQQPLSNFITNGE